MIKISKNVEVTKERVREYDNWRKKINLDYTSLPFLEYSRIRYKNAAEWPLFNLHASIYPMMVDSEDIPSEDDLKAAFRQDVESLTKFNHIARNISLFNFYVGLMNRNREYFLTQQFPRKSAAGNIKKPQLYTAENFVKEILQQEWKPDDIESADNPIDNSFKSYSEWHRKAMPDKALVMDVDYIEIRNNTPTCVFEVTKSNSDDLGYGLFSFLSRGFAQASVIIMVAEILNVKSYVITYAQGLERVEVLELCKGVIPKIDIIDRKRQIYAKAERDDGKNYSVAQGIAVSKLYKEQGADIMESLIPMRTCLSIVDFEKWLTELK